MARGPHGRIAISHMARRDDLRRCAVRQLLESYRKVSSTTQLSDKERVSITVCFIEQTGDSKMFQAQGYFMEQTRFRLLEINILEGRRALKIPRML